MLNVVNDLIIMLFFFIAAILKTLINYLITMIDSD